jgi:hypothetical protein
MTVLGVLAIVAGFQWLQAERQRQSANAARQSAEGILNYLLNQLSAKLEPIGHLDVVQDVQKQDGFMKEGSIRSGYYLRPSKAMGSDGGPTGDSKIRSALHGQNATKGIFGVAVATDATHTVKRIDNYFFEAI